MESPTAPPAADIAAQGTGAARPGEEAARDLPRNFAANLLSSSTLNFSKSLIGSEVVLPLFVSNLSGSPLWVGLIMTISFAGWLFPQVFTAPLVGQHRRIKKPLLTALFFGAHLPLLLLGPVVALLAGPQPGLMLGVFFCLLAWNSFGTGLTAVGSQELYARVIPVVKRGRLTGTAGAVGLLLALVGAGVNRRVLGAAGFPGGYALLFTLAGISGVVSWLWLTLVREPSPERGEPPDQERRTRSARWKDYLAFFQKIPGIVRADRNYAWFLASTAVLYLGGMSGSFLAVAAKDRWGLPESLIVTFPIAMYMGQGLGNLVGGFVADRTGYKVLKIVENAANVALLLIAIFAGQAWLFYVVFWLKGVSIAADVLGNLISLEFSAPELRPAYIGIYNTLSGVVFLFSPLLAGWLAATVGYKGLFWITAGITAVGIVMMMGLVRDPRKTRSI